MTLKSEMTARARSMVRDVLREVMALVPGTPARQASRSNARIASDGDLAAFVPRLVEPATAETVRAGAPAVHARAALRLRPRPRRVRYSRGVITEQKIDKAAGTATLVLAADAVLTPLARDKARQLGLKIERRR